MAEWSNEFTLQFLEAYQGESVLWDPKHRFHKDKKQVGEAWVRLCEALQPVQVVTMAELKKKDSLMATFRSHIRKKKNSIKSGAGVNEVYKPIWFAFEIMEAFLGPVYECNQTINTENILTEPAEIGEENTVDDERVQNETPSQNEQLAVTTSTPAQSQGIHRRGGFRELHDAGKQMKQAFDSVTKVLAKPRVEEDECDLYGKILAKKLRKLSEEERQIMTYDIDGLFIRRHKNFVLPSTSPNLQPLSRFSSSQSFYSDYSVPSLQVQSSFSGIHPSYSQHRPSSTFSANCTNLNNSTCQQTTENIVPILTTASSTPHITVLSDISIPFHSITKEAYYSATDESQ